MDRQPAAVASHPLQVVQREARQERHAPGGDQVETKVILIFLTVKLESIQSTIKLDYDH